MTVRELIKELQKLPQEDLVIVLMNPDGEHTAYPANRVVPLSPDCNNPEPVGWVVVYDETLQKEILN